MACTGNKRIQELSAAGVLLAQWGSFGFGLGLFFEPFGVPADGRGNMSVADTKSERIQKLNVAGQP